MTDAISPMESPIVFRCGGQELMGIVHASASAATRAVVLVVGGPQYRVGSHRQFVLLARTLAAAGCPVLRFDYRGMGDSEGDLRDFEAVSEDIEAAIDAAFQSIDGIRECVLWGLCDAASAASFYAQHDDRVTGLVLVNPWVRTEAGEARTRLRHYYLARLGERAFWRKLLRLRWNPLTTIADIGRFLARVRNRSAEGGSDTRAAPLPRRMRAGLESFGGRVLLILSGRDLTAREFEDTMAASSEWQAWMAHERVETCRLEDADHTFSRPEWRDRVACQTSEWLRTW